MSASAFGELIQFKGETFVDIVGDTWVCRSTLGNCNVVKLVFKAITTTSSRHYLECQIFLLELTEWKRKKQGLRVIDSRNIGQVKCFYIRACVHRARWSEMTTLTSDMLQVDWTTTMQNLNSIRVYYSN